MNVSFAQVLISNKAIIVDEYVYRQTNTLKNGDIVYVYSVNKKCNQSILPPCMWASVPVGDRYSPRTNNGPESFHGDAHFNARHHNIFIFLDVLQQI